MISRLTFLVVAFAAVFGASGKASDAETTLRETMDQALAVADHSPGGRKMADDLEPILLRRVSFEAMTRRAIGPGWRQFTPAQQQEATKLFTKLIIRSYSNKFTPGEKAEVKYLKGTSPAPDKMEIPTTMLYKGSRYSIVYRMENRGEWMITDILAEGVSLVANYRAQFDDLFKKGGASAILDSLKKSVAHT